MSLSAFPPGAQGMLKCLDDGLVWLPEHRCIHREVYLTCTALIREQEDPIPTQGCQEGLDVNSRVKRDREDVRAIGKAPHPDPLARVETVNEGSTFCHSDTKSFHEPLNTLQGECFRQTRRGK